MSDPTVARATMNLSLSDLKVLALTAERNGTTHAFQSVALEWCGKAQAEVVRLRAALVQANDQAERFERGWYLRGDALESIKKHCEQQPSALAAAIVATCKAGLEA